MFISIITSTLNSEKYLERCINSVKNQSIEQYEHIIVDGLSTDNTLEIIKNNKHNKLVVLTEKRKGIYPAWNKGVDHSKGKWILFLGSDDYLLHEDVLKMLYRDIRLSHNEPAFISCGIVKGDPLDDESSKKVKKIFATDIRDGLYDGPTLIMPPQPGLFHSRKLFSDGKRFDESYAAAADKKFYLEYFGKTNIQFVSLLITYFSIGGITNRSGNKLKQWLEKNRMRKELGLPITIEPYFRTLLSSIIRDTVSLVFGFRTRAKNG